MNWGRGILLVGLAFSAAGCGEKAPTAPEVKLVRTIVVDPKPIEDERSAVGEVRPRYESELGFLIAGKMVTRAVDIGVSVKKGDLLARLDEQDNANRLKSAEADFAAAEAVLVEARARKAASAIARQRHDDAGELRRRAKEFTVRQGEDRMRLRPPWISPRTNSVTPNCMPISTA